MTALMAAAFYGHGEVVELLLKYGADKSVRDGGGNTALDMARRRGHAALMTLLY